MYKDLSLSILLLFAVYLATDNKNREKIALSLVAASGFSLLLQSLIYLNPNVVLSYLKQFFNEKYLNQFLYQFNRDRFFGDLYDEVTLPFFLFFLTKEKKALNKTILIILIGLMFFITLISNWRSKAIMLVFSFTLSFFVYFKAIKKMILPLVLVVYFLLLFGNLYSLHTVGQNVIDRLIFPEYAEVTTIKSRFQYWREALDMGMDSPLFGVGLGNYFDNLSYSSKLANINSILNFNRSFITIDDPHNIFLSTFATTGLVGLITLLLLVFYFAYTDFFAFFKTRDFLLKSSIISFWTLFLYALFNPWMYFSYLTFFMLLRGYITVLGLGKNA